MGQIEPGAERAGMEASCDIAVIEAAPPAPRRARRVVGRVAGRRKTRRRVRWSKKAQATFFTALGEMCNVSAACRASGLASSTVYQRRRTDPDFEAAWVEAVREGYDRLKMEMLDRALNGVEKAVWHGGKVVGSVRHYSDGLALALMRLHGPTAGQPAPPPPAAREQTLEELNAWLSAMNVRMGGDG